MRHMTRYNNGTDMELPLRRCNISIILRNLIGIDSGIELIWQLLMGLWVFIDCETEALLSFSSVRMGLRNLLLVFYLTIVP